MEPRLHSDLVRSDLTDHPLAAAFRRRGRVVAVLTTVAALTATALGAPAVALDEPAVLPQPAAVTLSETVVIAAEVAPGATDDERVDLAESAAETVQETGGEVRVVDDGASIVSIEVPVESAELVEAEIADLDASAAVSRPVLFTPLLTPRDPQFRLQAGYLDPIRVRQAWTRSRGTARTTIAIVDTGVAVGHPDLRGQVRGRYNAVNGGRNVADPIGHGTSVASVAAARTNNRQGIAGVGWRTSLLAVKTADSNGQIWGDAVANGIRWATQRGADVINISLGSSQDDPVVRKEVARAVARGVVVVAAVSNEGLTRPTYPAAYPGVIGVGATGSAGLASFSDRGSTMDVAAPGVALRAAKPGGYRRVTGTSFAAAVVSGQAGLIRSERPRIAASEVARIIKTTTRAVGSGSAATRRIDLFHAVVKAQGVARPPQDVTAKARGRAVTVRWDPPLYEGRKPVNRYRLDIRRVGGPWRVAKRVDDSRERATVRRLARDRRFEVRVVAINPYGAGLPSRVVAVRTAR